MMNNLCLDHIGIVVASIDAALPYYRDTLGLTPKTGVVDELAQDVRVLFLNAVTGIGQDAGSALHLVRAIPIHNEAVSRKSSDYIGKTFQHLAVFGLKLFC